MIIIRLALIPLLVGCSGTSTVKNMPDEMQPIPIYLLAGQSNMEGFGPLTDANLDDWPLTGSLEGLIEEGSEDTSILQERDDVWVTFDSDSDVHLPGLLEPGFGASSQFLGPELGIGHSLGELWDEPIFLYKVAFGGSTLGADWKPPSAGGAGEFYERMMIGFKAFISEELPESFSSEINERGVEVAGFVWLQGWNDQFEDGFVAEYEDNLVSLVQSVRADLSVPDLATIIVEGPTLDEQLRQARLNALERLEQETPGRQAYVETEDLVEEEIEGNFHFHFNAGNYLSVGRRTAIEIERIR